MKKAAAAALLAILLTQPTKTEAKGIDGNTLLSQCENLDTGGALWCSGYVLGISQMIQEEGIMGATACPPANVRISQLVAAAMKNVREKPENLTAPGIYLVAGGIVKAFPCTKGN